MNEHTLLYQKDLEIVSSDVDAMRRLRPSALFTMVAEAAIAHTTMLGAGREKTLDKGYLWVVALQRVFISRMPEYDEKVSREGESDFFTVPYSFVDINGHMNNARYIDLAWDRMPADFRRRPVREIQTEYAGEVCMDQKVRLVSRAEEENFTLLGTDEAGEKVLFKIRVNAKA